MAARASGRLLTRRLRVLRKANARCRRRRGPRGAGQARGESRGQAAEGPPRTPRSGRAEGPARQVEQGSLTKADPQHEEGSRADVQGAHQAEADLVGVCDDAAWSSLHLLGLKKYMARKGLSQELVGAVASAESATARGAVLSFARLVDQGLVGVAHMRALAKVLGLADPWRNSQEFMLKKNKGKPKAAPGPVAKLPTAAASTFRAPKYTLPAAAEATPEKSGKPTLFEFFEDFGVGE